MTRCSEKGPRDGHTFRFRFDIRPSSRVIGDPEYTDGPDFMGPVNEIQVRAWDLRGALLRAAELPSGVLMGNAVSDREPPPNQRRLWLSIGLVLGGAVGYLIGLGVS